MHYLIRFVAAKTLVGYGMDIIIVLESTILCSGWRVWKTELHPKHKSKGKVKKIAFK